MDRYSIILGKEPPPSFVDLVFQEAFKEENENNPLCGKKVFAEIKNCSGRVLWRYDGIIVYVFKAGIKPDPYLVSIFTKGKYVKSFPKSDINRIVIKKIDIKDPEAHYAIVPERFVQLEEK